MQFNCIMYNYWIILKGFIKWIPGAQSRCSRLHSLAGPSGRQPRVLKLSHTRLPGSPGRTATPCLTYSVTHIHNRISITTISMVHLSMKYWQHVPVETILAERAHEAMSMGRVMGSRADPQYCVQNLQPGRSSMRSSAAVI